MVAIKEKKIPIPTKRKELRQIKIVQEDVKIAYSFAGKIYKKFGPLVLSVILFGSVAKGTPKKESDIDIVIVVDNVSTVWDQEVIAWYREELFKLVKSEPARDRIHINTITISNFWENVLKGEPAVVNMLRYGVALLDLGFFEPIKLLLLQGRIRPSAEAIYTTANRTPWHIMRARIKTLSAVEDLYWAMVDAAHAALMTAGRIPPSPEHIGELLKDEFVGKKRLPKFYVGWYEEVYKLAHDIKNHKVHKVSGEDYDTLVRRTQEFSRVMLKLTQEEEKKFLKRRGLR